MGLPDAYGQRGWSPWKTPTCSLSTRGGNQGAAYRWRFPGRVSGGKGHRNSHFPFPAVAAIDADHASILRRYAVNLRFLKACFTLRFHRLFVALGGRDVRDDAP